MANSSPLLARLLRFRTHRRRHRNSQSSPSSHPQVTAADTAQPASPRGAMGDVLTPTLDDAQPLAQPAGEDSGPGLKLPTHPNTLSEPAAAAQARRDSLHPPSNSHPTDPAMAAPTITVEHPPNANPLDNFSEFLATKTCFAFVIDTTLYDHRAATALATDALLQAVADAHNAPYDILQATYADLCASHPPQPQETRPAHQKQILRDLLASIPHALTPEQAAAQIDDLFRLYKKTMYAQLHPAPGVLPLLRSLLKRTARIVIAVDPSRSQCTNDMAAWLVEHLYLDNFVDRIAVLEENSDSKDSNNGFADVLKRLDARPDETVLFAGARRDAHGIAAREGVSLVVVDADAVAQHPEDLRGRASDQFGYVRQAAGAAADDSGAWEIGGLMVARNAVRMTLHERDRSVDSARM